MAGSWESQWQLRPGLQYKLRSNSKRVAWRMSTVKTVLLEDLLTAGGNLEEGSYNSQLLREGNSERTAWNLRLGNRERFAWKG